MTARVRTSPRRRASGWAAVAAIAAAATACSGSAGTAVVAAPAVARLVHFQPTGIGPMSAKTDVAITVERRSTVLRLEVSEGEHVERGQLLLKVFTIGQTRRIAQLSNALRTDENRLPFVTAQYGELSAQRLAVLDDLARLRRLLTVLKHAPTRLTAPVSGWVEHIDTSPGATLQRSHPAMHVVDDTVVRVVVSLPAYYRSQVPLNTPAVVTVAYLPGRSFAGTAIGAGAVTEPRAGTTGLAAEQTVPVTVQVPNPGRVLDPGSTAYAKFPLVDHARVAVDSLAVLDQDLPFVFVVDHGRVHERAVVVGPSDGAWTAIDAGLSPGELVVVSGGHDLVDGSPVTVTRAGAG